MSSQMHHETLLDGEVQIYVREGNRKATYQVRFDNIQDDSKRYVRASLKTSNRSLAIERAIAMYREHHSRAFLGLKSDCVSIEDLMAVGLPKLDSVSAETARGLYKTYWAEYMKDKDLSTWKTADIDTYFNWRVQKSINSNGAHWRPSANTVSVSSLKLEKNILRNLFKHGYSNQIIARIPDFPYRLDRINGTHKLPQNSRRGRFTDDQYKIVSSDFAFIRKSLNDTSLQPSTEPTSNRFESWSKTNGVGSSKTVAEAKRWAVRSTSRFSRAQYWFICILIANTGIRPAEIVKLRHKDISIKKSSEDGRYYTVIQIDSSVSKVKKYRDVIAQDLHKTFERYLEYKRELQFRFNLEPSAEDWLLPRQNDYSSRIVKLNNVVRPNLQRIGLHKSKAAKNNNVETYFSAYSFRAFYITKRLQNGLNIYTLAKNCGVSIQTLSSTYDYNENWEFRKQMTEHIGKWSAGESTKFDLSEFAEDWK